MQVVPQIVTRYDTVSSLPKWYQDSVDYWKKRKHTTDTVNVVVSQTVYDTAYINVGHDSMPAQPLWPLVRYDGTSKFGDTATVTTFDLRSGHLGISRIYQAGILTKIEVQENNPTPKLTFEPFPKTKAGSSLLSKIGFGLVGYGACSIVNLAK